MRLSYGAFSMSVNIELILVLHAFVKKSMVRYMRPHRRFAHCLCENAAITVDFGLSGLGRKLWPPVSKCIIVLYGLFLIKLKINQNAIIMVYTMATLILSRLSKFEPYCYNGYLRYRLQIPLAVTENVVLRKHASKFKAETVLYLPSIAHNFFNFRPKCL